MRKVICASLVLLAGLPRSVAAVPDGGHAHMNDDPIVAMLRVDELEWQNVSPENVLAWDMSAWIGRDGGRLLFRSEGEMTDGDVEDSRAELLWSKPVAAWWDLVAGLRQDTGTGPGRTYGLVGVQGLMPYRLHLEADVFGGEGEQLGTRVESNYELLITNRLILEPRVELQAFGKDDPATGIGSGLSHLEAGVRLRYEIRREFAPYAGVEWSGKFGETADLAEDADEVVRDFRFVAGVRFWF